MTSREDWMRRLGPLYGGAVALVHSTPWRWPLAVGDEARSSGWIVALGAPIGIVAWAVAALAHGAGFPSAVCALLGLAMLSAASAALVERGVVERVGSNPAVVSLVVTFTILVRAAAFVALPSSRWLGVLVATALVGRWAAVFLQSLGDPISDESARHSLVATPAPAWLSGALALAVAAVLVVVLGKGGIVVLAVTAAITFAIGLDAQRRDGGLSAPIIATAAAIGELCVLLIATIS
jgi:cobalamin synthase